MPRLGLVLAQCVDTSLGCELPRTLPWYFAVAIACAWLAAVVGAVLLLRRRLLARRAGRGPSPDELVEGRGTELEIW